MKKYLSLVLAFALSLPLAGCGGQSVSTSTPPETGASGAPVELVVFAAASLEATLTEIAGLYRDVAPNTDLTFTFDSSGTLRDQIREGAVCDLFLSAGQAQMDALDAADTTGTNTDGSDYVVSDTRIDFVENKVVLAVPDDNPAGILSFSDLSSNKLSLLCLGNEDVPVGSYSLEILEHLGIDIAKLEAGGRVTYASNVSEVARQVKEGAVDCGIIYATDAVTYGLTVVDEAEEGMCSPVIYPAAVMKSSNPGAEEAARAFLDYLHTDLEAVRILKSVGFTVL